MPSKLCKMSYGSRVLQSADAGAATPAAISKPWYGWDGSKLVELPSVTAGIDPNTIKPHARSRTSMKRRRVVLDREGR